MCGILLEFNKVGSFAPNFQNRLDELGHRGKDVTSITYHSTCKIGYKRLSITNIDKTPVIHPNGWHVVLNGEIYNYEKLGFEGSEVEVLAQGFAKYGCEFVKRLNGMFVIVAICGADVYVFRDRYGIKPFYFYELDGGLILSSEIKPILQHPKYRFSVNESARLQWLTFNNVFTDDTLFHGIRKMDKGTCWHLNTGKVTKYWEWNFAPQPMDYHEAVMQVRLLVIQAVERMTPNEVPFGCLLSGGIDSGIIANLLPDCPSFTAGYDGGDERELAELTKKSKHYEIVFNRVTNFTDTILHLEDLRVGASWSNYGIFELASKFCKVVFDGTGADELFGGYEWRYKEPNYWNIVNRTGIENDHCRRIFEQAFYNDTLAERFKFDADYFLEGVLLVTDRLSMAHTIEVRPVFLDNDLVDFALTLPNEFKQGKRILKDAFADVLPREVLTAKKQGWSSPDWFTDGKNKAERWGRAALAEWEKLFNFETKISHDRNTNIHCLPGGGHETIQAK